MECISKYQQIGIPVNAQYAVFADFIEARTKYWTSVYIKLYGAANVTPYIHRFANHLADCYRRHGNIYLCHLQGMENSNQVASRNYRSGNNKQRVHMIYLKQLLLKSLRVAVLEKELGYCFNCRGRKIIFNNDEVNQPDMQDHEEEEIAIER
jgi:hypothetical protein